MSLKLNLGCGHNYLKGWVNIDGPKDKLCYDDLKADVHSRIEEVSYAECSVSEILMSAVLEHFPRNIAISQLRKFYTWLEDNGKITILVPDFFATVEKLKKSESAEEQLFWWRHIFGPQDTVAFGTHYDGFDEEKLKLMFLTVGFSKFICTKEGRWPSLRFTAFKKSPFMPEEEARQNIINYLSLYEAGSGTGRAFAAWTEAIGYNVTKKPITPKFRTQHYSLFSKIKNRLKRFKHGGKD